MNSFLIGKWNEKESRKLEGHTGYAADYINHETVPGEYEVRLSISGGYTIPMPQWVLIAIDSEIVSGKTFSGFGGVNFASRDVETGPSHWHVQTYPYHIPKMVETGTLVLNEKWEFLNQEFQEVINHIKEHGLPA